jgi:hypothetical protein
MNGNEMSGGEAVARAIGANGSGLMFGMGRKGDRVA